MSGVSRRQKTASSGTHRVDVGNDARVGGGAGYTEAPPTARQKFASVVASSKERRTDCRRADVQLAKGYQVPRTLFLPPTPMTMIEVPPPRVAPVVVPDEGGSVAVRVDRLVIVLIDRDWRIPPFNNHARRTLDNHRGTFDHACALFDVNLALSAWRRLRLCPPRRRPVAPSCTRAAWSSALVCVSRTPPGHNAGNCLHRVAAFIVELARATQAPAVVVAGPHFHRSATCESWTECSASSQKSAGLQRSPIVQYLRHWGRASELGSSAAFVTL
jgi:hypothetical protein